MTNFSAIENKISLVKKYLKILTRYKKFFREQIEKDVDIRGMVERYLYLGIQASIDLAEAIISLKNFRKPTTLSENFYILEEEKIISKKLTEEMAKLVGLRNILSHQYGKINYDIVYDVLQNRLGIIEEFINQIKTKLKI